MLAIILSACLANDPNVCKDYRIPLADDVDIDRCAVEAPPHFARWADDHPGWQIKRWKCTTGSQSDI